MENQIPAYEGNLIYDFEETAPRYCVEFLKPCPNLSPNTTVYFDGFFWNECGIVFQYNDGDNFKPRSFTLKVVFPCTIKSMRMFAMTVHQENKLFDLQQRSAAANLSEPIFHFYRCKYSNYYFCHPYTCIDFCTGRGFERVTIFYKGIMPSEKILDLPVDCNTLTGSVNLGYENINHLALIVKAHGLPIIQIARNAVNL